MAEFLVKRASAGTLYPTLCKIKQSLLFFFVGRPFLLFFTTTTSLEIFFNVTT